MRLIAALTEPASIRRCLQGMGLSWRAPPIAPAGPDPQPLGKVDGLDRVSVLISPRRRLGAE